MCIVCVLVISFLELLQTSLASQMANVLRSTKKRYEIGVKIYKSWEKITEFENKCYRLENETLINADFYI